MKLRIKVLIVLVAVGIALGGLAYASVQYNVGAIRQAIDSIGTVTYSEESRALIDAAQEAVAQADPNFHLEDRIDNFGALKAAQVEYVRLAIKRMYIAIRDKQEEVAIREYLADAEEAFAAYLTPGDEGLLSNFQDLKNAREKYGQPAQISLPKPTAPQPATVELDLCGP